MADEWIKASSVVPSERQLNWQETEFYAFCHFGMNTFTDKEWGDGTDSPELFNPTDFNADQWVEAIKNGGMKGLILTCKHHDGFCLWPSRYTDYSVKNSPFMNGQGDIVREVSSACKKAGIKFGVYLSPWDRHEKTYGTGKDYNTYFKNQLEELLTNYGELFCVWFDGACGEGKNGKKQEYDWQGYYSLIRRLQPNAVISISGPDVRWCGNEAGICRKSEWSVVPSEFCSNLYTAEHSQKTDGEAPKKKEMVLDLGSRKAIKGKDDFIWYPAEVDVSIRPGWFYHESEDFKLLEIKKLRTIYYNSVGANANLLLNIPPDRTGRINNIDCLELDSFRRSIEKDFYYDRCENAHAFATSEAGSDCPAKNILEKGGSFWQCDSDDETPEVIINLGGEKTFDKVVLMENIATGQQIEQFTLFYDKGGKWKRLFKSTVIGYKRICLFKAVKSSRIKIRIDSCRNKATLKFAGVYMSKE
ncbi:MAG: alpha-fucosidase [Ruminococcaceae bacterium]|nr:alpha-fucosidase [Oscillospiraceae bacterium]